MIRVVGALFQSRLFSFDEHDGPPRYCPWGEHWFTTEDMIAAQYTDRISHGICPTHQHLLVGTGHQHQTRGDAA